MVILLPGGCPDLLRCGPLPFRLRVNLRQSRPHCYCSPRPVLAATAFADGPAPAAGASSTRRLASPHCPSPPASPRPGNAASGCGPRPWWLAIYSTLGLAQTLAERLGNDFFSVWLFLLGCILVLLAVVTQGLRVRPSGIEIAVALGVAAAYLLVFVRMAIPTERSHLVEYGVVAVLGVRGARRTGASGAPRAGARPCWPS